MIHINKPPRLKEQLNSLTINPEFENWHAYKNDNMKSVMLHLCLNMVYDDTLHPVWHIPLGRCELITSSETIADKLGYSSNDVRECLYKLQKAGDIEIESLNGNDMKILVLLPMTFRDSPNAEQRLLEQDNCWIVAHPQYSKPWQIILDCAHRKDKPFAFLKRGVLCVCQRDECIRTMSDWAIAFGPEWTRHKVRTFFEHLKRQRMIQTQNAQVATRLRVL
ncbi:MAG: hypothetical protein HRT89_07605 [Lentisphaeria bacterium]|nr:hypothetical protein [Lentisphaeria bacterium]